MLQPQNKSSASFAAWGALLFAALPLLVAVLTLAIFYQRLDEGGRRVDAGMARVAVSWLADRAAPLPAGQREAFLAEAGRRMGALAGLHDRESGFGPSSDLAGVSVADVERISSQDIGELSIGGVTHQVSAASLRAPLSRLSVVLAVPPGSGGGVPEDVMARLAVLAVLLLLAAAIFGACFGRDFGLALEALGQRLELLARGAPRDETLRPASSRELIEVEGAVQRLERRLADRIRPGIDPGRGDAYAIIRADDLLTSVARDLHRPLRSIVETADALLEGRAGELMSSQQEDIRIIRQASERLGGMVGEIMDLTALMDREIELEMEPVTLAEVAKEVIRAGRGELKKKPVELTLEAEDPAAMVRGDRRRLWQVMTNLVSNAIKFTERGSVTVRIMRDTDRPGMVRLEVRDTGVGIPSMEQSEVFETFRQIRGTTGGRRGTGLGLAITRRLVELHGGTIRVDSDVGQGACFTVLLPEAP